MADQYIEGEAGRIVQAIKSLSSMIDIKLLCGKANNVRILRSYG